MLCVYDFLDWQPSAEAGLCRARRHGLRIKRSSCHKQPFIHLPRVRFTYKETDDTDVSYLLTDGGHIPFPRGLERGHRLRNVRRHQDHPVLPQGLLR